MITPVQITFRNVKSSEKVQRWIEAEAAKLEQFYDRITGCRVVVEVPNRRRSTGSRYHVRIDLTVPGTELVANRKPNVFRSLRQTGLPKRTKSNETDAPHRELRQAINDAFKEMGRMLQDYARLQRGDTKTHSLRAPVKPKNSATTVKGKPRSASKKTTPPQVVRESVRTSPELEAL